MKRILIVLIGIAALAFLLVEPHFEGRNVNATLFEIYFKDPFLAFAYVASIPFFVALYQAFNASSHMTVKALRTIKYCAIALIGFAVVGEIIIMMTESDDRAGGVMMGLLVILGSIFVAAATTMYEKRLRLSK